ncbi:MAG TPA: penicillin-binding protein 2 [Candidatus Methylacidiphilales bacterium]|jgi:cell division protein FtsI (penicillin-binding protein 3)/stage V sporulation protein D (sporulation-specific penicillin-binding protein)|nr:penicillin-binding protein 2 [Candidatus Methylacidiphilales bacterium]
MQHRTRAIWIVVFLACGFTAISFNLIQIQLVDHDKYWRQAIANHTHREEISPRRGSLYDIDGDLLAQTQQVYDIRLDGQLMSADHPKINLSKIAQALQVPEEAFVNAFNPRNRDQLLAENLDETAVAKFRALKLDSLIILEHDRRFYPNNELAAHILGFVGDDGHGMTGMEKEMDRLLCGTPGERQVERDAKRHEIAVYQDREKPAVDGCNVTLTIKMAIQHVVEDQLDQIEQTYRPAAAYIIVMDPQTGEILAMGSRPNYDPNDRKTFTPDNTKERCLTDMVEPGSIFKIITLAGALNEGLVNLNTQVFCENGSFYYGGRILKDDDEQHGWLPVDEVMAQSSNIGFAKIGLSLGEERLYKYATAFGMGRRTGLFTQQMESPGILRPVSKWSALSITRIPMGQEVAATPIQLVTAMSVIANGGRLVVPQLTRQVTDETGRVVKVYQPQVVRQVISASAARDVARALEQVTVDGTAKNIHIEGHSFAAKTGTAQKFIDGEYSHTQHVASFLGFMPVEDPAFVALVMVDDPKTAPRKDYGAEVSGPVFASIANQVAQILNIPPDLPVSTAPVLSSNSTPAAL